MLKYSLGTLLLVTAMIGLGCAAFVNPSELWSDILVTMTLVFLMVQLVVALVATGRTRAFAVGFAAVGWAYFLLTIAGTGMMKHELLTSRCVNWLYQWKQSVNGGDANADTEDDDGRMGAVGFGMGRGAMGGGMATFTFPAAPPELQDVGHALWTQILAFFAGMLGQAIHHKSRRDESVTG